MGRFPNHPRALEVLSAIARMVNSPSMSLPYFEGAVRLYLQYALIHAQFGVYLVDIGQLEVGSRELTKVSELGATLSLAQAWLARAYGKSGDSQLAREAVKRARALGYKGEIP